MYLQNRALQSPLCHLAQLSTLLRKCRTSGNLSRGLTPIAPRTFSEYMNKLGEVRLVKLTRARIRGKVRLFKAVR